ncbi:MAG TPA: DUF3293 domain-containing protein [Rhodanobacteraceae bacterium]
MPVPESILRAWRDTDYRIRLAQGGYASIRDGRPLPASLLALLQRADEPWGYLTAWNPAGVRLPHATNRIRQRRLRDELKSSGYRYYCGIGVGAGDWREPSLFVPGIKHSRLIEVARHFGQLGLILGSGAEPAKIHELV